MSVFLGWFSKVDMHFVASAPLLTQIWSEVVPFMTSQLCHLTCHGQYFFTKSSTKYALQRRQKPGLASQATGQCLMFHHFLPSSKNLKWGIVPALLHWSDCLLYPMSYLTLSHSLVCQNLKKYVAGIGQMGSNSQCQSFPKVSAIMGATLATRTVS